VRAEHGLHLTGLVGDAQTGRVLRAEAADAAGDAQALGQHVADLLLAQGAGEMLGL
jgi:hydroxymethylbilane synthase